MINLGPMNDTVLAVWGESVTVYLFGATPIEAVYDSRHYEVIDGEAGGSSRFTSLGVREEDAENVVEQETELTARGVVYRVTEKRPDGGGWVILALEKTGVP